ncbi:PIG-L family deacetylase [Ancylobacter sonchi]|nr:PIG-L family deacetylase [Ancylobacter sonchi]
MNAASALRAMDEFPLATPHDFVRRGLVVVAPHPDDESLGCGGLISACRAEGVPVAIIIVSDGAGSHPNSQLFPPSRLAALRCEEAIEAARHLGVACRDVHFLDFPDRHVPSSGPELRRAANRVAALSGQADVMAVSWRHDPHCDHQASYVLAVAAASLLPGLTLWEYPIWGLTLDPLSPLPDPPCAGVRVLIEEHLPTKRQAIAAHLSQTTNLVPDDPHGFRLTAPMLALFGTPWEIFIRSDP